MVYAYSLHPGAYGRIARFVRAAMWLAVHFFSSFSFSPNKTHFQPEVMAYRYYFRRPGCKHFSQPCNSSDTELPEEGILLLSPAPGEITTRSVWLFSAAGVKTLQNQKKGRITTNILHTWKRRHGETGHPRLDGRAGNCQTKTPLIAILDFPFCFNHGVNRMNKHQFEAPEASLWVTWTTLLLFPW